MMRLCLLLSMFVVCGCDGGAVQPSLSDKSVSANTNTDLCSDAIDCQNKGLSYVSQGEEHGYQQARLYFKAACDLGESEGCNNLAFLNANGRGGTQSYTLAYKYWGIACKMGNQLACTNLGLAKEKVANMHKQEP